MKKGPLYEVTNTSTGEVIIVNNWDLITWVITTSRDSSGLRDIKIEKIENPTETEWLLYGEKKDDS